jgi:hypothetical protein
MKKVAQFLSFVFGPPLVPVYGVWAALNLSILSVLPAVVRWSVLGVVAMIVCVVPLLGIWALHKIGFLSDTRLRNQDERTMPYFIIMLCYIGCAFFLYKSNAPLWLVMFIVGAVVATLICAIVNRWWKISAHMTAMGGFMAMVMRMAISHLGDIYMLYPVIIVALLCGLVGSSRLILGRHTPMQVLAGFAVGYICVYFSSGLI